MKVHHNKKTTLWRVNGHQFVETLVATHILLEGAPDCWRLGSFFFLSLSLSEVENS